MIIKNWKLQPLLEQSLIGTNISSNTFDDSDWFDVTLPNSIVGNYVEAGVFDNPYIGDNLTKIPGYKKDKKLHFTFFRMPDGSPFRKSFWYRTEVTLTKEESKKVNWLKLKGINYKANLWINGKRVEDSSFIIGTYKTYDLNISHWVTEGTNIIAIEVEPQEVDELGITFIDWCPTPPDDSAGIWQDIELYQTDITSIKTPYIKTYLNSDYSQANIEVSFTVVNNSRENSTREITVMIDSTTIKKTISLAPLEEVKVVIDKEEITINSPHLWWPYELGTPYLYNAHISVASNKSIDDTREISFGIKDITATINTFGSLEVSVNKTPILIKGAAWSPDLLLRQDFERDGIDIEYVKAMNLNTIRLEGKLATDNFWELCDKEGILVMAGWPCCTHWEKWDKWKQADFIVARYSLRSQLQRLRNHPSFIMWLYGSDYPPIESVERIYLEELEKYAPHIIHISSASQFTSSITGKTGVKMTGPYGYVPPSYWYDETMPGFANSFNTETGPDSSFPRFETVCKMIPNKKERYVGSKTWNLHAGLASFLDTEIMTQSIENRYGVKREEIEKFLFVAQMSNYEAWRAMFEAYNQNFPQGTGVIAWMMNGQWPSVIWQLYDYYLYPTGGFYGVKKAAENIHIQYNYIDKTVWVINNGTTECIATVNIIINDGYSDIYSKNVPITMKANSRQSIYQLEDNIAELFFLKLELKDSALISRNTYLLSNKLDILKAEQTKKEWFYRPIVEPVSFQKLIEIELPELSFEKTIKDNKIIITVKNSGHTVAVGLLFDLLDNENNPIPTALWNDNYLNIFPNETVDVICNTKLVNGNFDTVRVSHMNGEVQCL